MSDDALTMAARMVADHYKEQGRVPANNHRDRGGGVGRNEVGSNIV